MTTTGAPPPSAKPAGKYILADAFPNPFNPSATIRYQIPERTHVQLKVYDVLGKEAAVMVNGIQSAGYYEEVFNAGSLSSVVYIYRLTAGGQSASKKITLVK